MIETVVIGDEYDQELKGRLRNVLRLLGAEIEETNWGVGGSQEQETVECVIDGESLTIASETYIGLSLTGETGLIGRIVDELKAE